MAGRHRTENELLDAWLLMQLSQLRLASSSQRSEPPGEAAEAEDQRQSGTVGILSPSEAP